MRSKLNKKQIELLSRIGIPENVIDDTDESVIEEKVADHLQMYGFDDNYELTEDGEICESILDLVA